MIDYAIENAESAEAAEDAKKFSRLTINDIKP
jgi:hypothetical protein